VNYAFHPDAEAEYLEAVAFYEIRRAGLGATFIAEFEHVLARVYDAPGRYPIVRQPDIRSIRLQRFPFKIHYREQKGGVQILAVAHDRRRPAYWVDRL
jgi:toxin ParE1/3/4